MFTLTLDEILLFGYRKLAANYEIFERCGIYKIECSANKYIYVGGTSIKFIYRWQYHINNLRKNIHRNKHLQSAYDLHKYLSFSILEVIENKEILIQKEQAWLDSYQSSDYFICNILPPDPSIPRMSPTLETRERISAGQRRVGNKPSQEASQKAYETNRVKMLGNTRALGHKLSEEVKKAISERSMGNQHGKGYRHTPEAKEKISQAAKQMWERKKKKDGTMETQEK